MYAAVGLLECLWQLTTREAPRGDIGKLTNEDIAIFLGWQGDEAQLIRELISCGWIDECAHNDPHCAHSMRIHDWAEHADDAVHMALARKVEFFADGTIPRMSRLSEEMRTSLKRQFESKCAHTTPQKEASVRTAMPSPAMPSPTFNIVRADALPGCWDKFCQEYPKRNGALNKAKAAITYERLKDKHPEVMIGVVKYRQWCDATKITGTQYVKQMTTWLNQKGWEEDYEIPDTGPESRLKDLLDD
jgi:hypothetical protein